MNGIEKPLMRYTPTLVAKVNLFWYANGTCWRSKNYFSRSGCGGGWTGRRTLGCPEDMKRLGAAVPRRATWRRALRARRDMVVVKWKARMRWKRDLSPANRRASQASIEPFRKRPKCPTPSENSDPPSKYGRREREPHV